MESYVGRDIGKYHIVEQLGEGGMAVVYKAFDTALERLVALKFIRKELIGEHYYTRVMQRFEREAKTLASLDHPNIVAVYDFGQYEGSPYIVMKFIPCGALKMDGQPWPVTQAAQLLAPVARALMYAHSHGVIHRDLKPSNILLCEDGRPTLSDFGIAKILDESGVQKSITNLTGTGMAIGTPEYMAPEQWMGKPTAQSDIYGLGVVLYELVTGQRPYSAETPAAVMIKQVSEPLPRPRSWVPSLPEEVEGVIFKALAMNPENRFPTMAEFAAALEQIAHGGYPAPVEVSAVGNLPVSAAKTGIPHFPTNSDSPSEDSSSAGQPAASPEAPPAVVVPPQAELTAHTNRENNPQPQTVPIVHSPAPEKIEESQRKRRGIPLLLIRHKSLTITLFAAGILLSLVVLIGLAFIIPLTSADNSKKSTQTVLGQLNTQAASSASALTVSPVLTPSPMATPSPSPSTTPALTPTPFFSKDDGVYGILLAAAPPSEDTLTLLSMWMNDSRSALANTGLSGSIIITSAGTYNQTDANLAQIAIRQNARLGGYSILTKDHDTFIVSVQIYSPVEDQQAYTRFNAILAALSESFEATSLITASSVLAARVTAAVNTELGIRAYQQGDYSECARRLTAVNAQIEKLKVSHSRAEINNTYLGTCLSAIGQADAGRDAFLNAMDVNPAYAGAYFGLGNYYYSQGDLELAAFNYNETLKLAPQDPLATGSVVGHAYAGLGNIAILQETYDDAIDYFDKALSTDPGYPGYFLARALAKKGKGGLDDQVEADLQACIDSAQTEDTDYYHQVAANCSLLLKSTGLLIGSVTSGNVYLRKGPGTEHPAVEILSVGQKLTIVSRDPAARWAAVIAEDGANGWVALETIQFQGDIDQIPTASVMPTSPQAGQPTLTLASAASETQAVPGKSSTPTKTSPPPTLQPPTIPPKPTLTRIVTKTYTKTSKATTPAVVKTTANPFIRFTNTPTGWLIKPSPTKTSKPTIPPTAAPTMPPTKVPMRIPFAQPFRQ
jgi:serine/threonine protein kinase/tetratricopeptide (TPR) repeat protein